MSGKVLILLLSYTTCMSIYQVASFAGSCAQVSLLCKLIGGAQSETLEFNCWRPLNVTRLLKRKSNMTPKTLTCDLDSHVRCLPAVFL